MTVIIVAAAAAAAAARLGSFAIVSIVAVAWAAAALLEWRWARRARSVPPSPHAPRDVRRVLGVQCALAIVFAVQGVVASRYYLVLFAANGLGIAYNVARLRAHRPREPDSAQSDR